MILFQLKSFLKLIFSKLDDIYCFKMNFIIILIFLCFNLSIRAENSEISAWKSYNFKLLVKKGHVECFYEPVIRESLLYISFQVNIYARTMH
jgi:hypothetical protein